MIFRAIISFSLFTFESPSRLLNHCHRPFVTNILSISISIIISFYRLFPHFVSICSSFLLRHIPPLNHLISLSFPPSLFTVQAMCDLFTLLFILDHRHRSCQCVIIFLEHTSVEPTTIGLLPHLSPIQVCNVLIDVQEEDQILKSLPPDPVSILLFNSYFLFPSNSLIYSLICFLWPTL